MRMKVKPQTKLSRVLTLLLLLCLLCACGAGEPRNWVPVGGGSPEAADSVVTDPVTSETLVESPTSEAATTAEATSLSTLEALTEPASPTEEPTAPQSTEAIPGTSTESAISTEALPPETSTEPLPDRAPSAATEASEEDAQVHYIANTNSKKFHLPTCSSVKDMKESNKWYFTGTREELIQQGYEPCKRCKP